MRSSGTALSTGPITSTPEIRCTLTPAARTLFFKKCLEPECDCGLESNASGAPSGQTEDTRYVYDFPNYLCPL